MVVVALLSKTNAGYSLLADIRSIVSHFRTLNQLPIYLASVIFVIMSKNNDNYGMPVTGRVIVIPKHALWHIALYRPTECHGKSGLEPSILARFNGAVTEFYIREFQAVADSCN